MQRLRLMSYNIQAGIHSRHYRDYFAQGWKHILPHGERQRNLASIGAQLHGYDIVGLQEVDAAACAAHSSIRPSTSPSSAVFRIGTSRSIASSAIGPGTATGC